jgi:hypothetical protein
MGVWLLGAGVRNKQEACMGRTCDGEIWLIVLFAC